MASKEAEELLSYICIIPEAGPVVKTFVEFSYPYDLDQFTSVGLISQVNPSKLSSLPPSQYNLEILLTADNPMYALELQMRPELTRPPVFLAKMEAGWGPLNEAKSGYKINIEFALLPLREDPLLKDWVQEVVRFFDTQVSEYDPQPQARHYPAGMESLYRVGVARTKTSVDCSRRGAPRGFTGLTHKF